MPIRQSRKSGISPTDFAAKHAGYLRAIRPGNFFLVNFLPGVISSGSYAAMSYIWVYELGVSA